MLPDRYSERPQCIDGRQAVTARSKPFDPGFPFRQSAQQEGPMGNGFISGKRHLGVPGGFCENFQHMWEPFKINRAPSLRRGPVEDEVSAQQIRNFRIHQSSWFRWRQEQRLEPQREPG